MKWIGTFILGAAVVAGAGCANSSNRGASATQAVQATRPSGPAYLKLDEIQPRPVLPEPAKVAPGRPPLDAIELYARARAAILNNQRFTAINYLERALEIDPDSYELNFALGMALLGGGNSKDEAVERLERAAELRPDHLDVHVQLGRQYLSRGELPKAVHHLRLALLTTGYREDAGDAAVADLLLAQALQQSGYDRAALDQYLRLKDRLGRGGISLRNNPELYYLVNRPDVLALQIAKLHDRLGEPEAALASYEIALAEEEGNFDLHSRIVRALIAAGRGEDAVARAAKAVLRFRANREALALLREACKAVGREDKVADELNRLHRERPGDRAILFALADVLASEGREVESERILTAAALEGDGDVEAVRRLYRTYESRGETLKAARLLLEATATNADTTSEIANMIEGLIRTSRRGALRISALQQLEVSEKAQAAKWYWTARLASVWNRDALMMSSLEKATHAPGATFDPAYRLLLSLYWVKGDWDQKQKSDASQTLVEAATERNAGALAAELRGRILAYQGRHDQAAKMFEEAIEQGGDSPELHIAYADALLRQKLDGRAEQTLWKIVSDWPTFEAGYRSLFEYYVERQSISQAMKVLQTWLAADPDSVLARITQVRVFVQARRPDAAEQVLLETFRQNPDDGLLLQFMQAYYDQMGRLRDFAQMLKKEWADNPENREVVEQLTQVYVRLNRMADAMRVLDSTRAAVADDPDLLYYVASLYHRIGQKQSSEEVMLQVLEMQPDHAPANNDLGYAWADEGRNLKRAEAMIRIAVKAEPDNQSFLDSLGWVLYKRGRFAEAHKYLVEAIGPAALPDPIVLDHLGDVLYRLNRHDEAVKQWQRSLDRLGEVVANREDLRQLRSVLVRKLEQANAGQPVDVAPVIETPQQASN